MLRYGGLTGSLVTCVADADGLTDPKEAGSEQSLQDTAPGGTRLSVPGHLEPRQPVCWRRVFGWLFIFWEKINQTVLGR